MLVPVIMTTLYALGVVYAQQENIVMELTVQHAYIHVTPAKPQPPVTHVERLLVVTSSTFKMAHAYLPVKKATSAMVSCVKSVMRHVGHVVVTLIPA